MVGRKALVLGMEEERREWGGWLLCHLLFTSNGDIHDNCCEDGGGGWLINSRNSRRGQLPMNMHECIMPIVVEFSYHHVER